MLTNKEKLIEISKEELKETSSYFYSKIEDALKRINSSNYEVVIEDETLSYHSDYILITRIEELLAHLNYDYKWIPKNEGYYENEFVKLKISLCLQDFEDDDD